MKEYTSRFYEHQRERSRQSAQEIVPIVIDLVGPRSVVDIGCGSGAWLSVFREQGIDDIVGVDGEWVDKEMLLIPPDRFVPAVLHEQIPVDRTFDLVMSLEVAEHLPEENAEAFVSALTRLGPAVLFSAAVPGQGGTHHRNEQWQGYWADLFHKQGYEVVDCIRNRVWQNENVEWWYAQNIFLYIRKDQIHRYPEAKQTGIDARQPLVHPSLYLASKDPTALSLRDILPALPAIAWNSMKKSIRFLAGRG